MVEEFGLINIIINIININFNREKIKFYSKIIKKIFLFDKGYKIYFFIIPNKLLRYNFFLNLLFIKDIKVNIEYSFIRIIRVIITIGGICIYISLVIKE